MGLNLYGGEAVRHKLKNRQKQAKNAFFVFFGHFWAYVGQPHDHIGWAPSMPFALINPTNPRTDPWNFHKKILRIGDFEKCTFFESAILNFFFRKKNFFFCFFPMKISQILLVSKDGSKFWSSQTWQHFLTHTKHSWGECIYNSITAMGFSAVFWKSNL